MKNEARMIVNYKESDNTWEFRTTTSVERGERMLQWCYDMIGVDNFYLSRQEYTDGTYDITCRISRDDYAVLFRCAW